MAWKLKTKQLQNPTCSLKHLCGPKKGGGRVVEVEENLVVT